MQSNYIKVFSLDLTHSYFKNNIDAIFTLTPSTATQTLIDQYNFKLIQNKNSFQFYANTNNSISDLLNYISQTIDTNSFTFDITINNSEFYLFTELPINFIGKLMYSSNDSLNKIEGETIILQQRLTQEAIQGNAGSIKLLFSDLQNITPTNFKISFEARATIWQYYIINKSRLNIDNLQIRSNSNIQFSESKKVTLPNDEEALVFTSKSLITLSNTPQHKFDLITGSNEKTIFSGLPIPNPAQLMSSQNQEDLKLYSPIYVYI